MPDSASPLPSLDALLRMPAAETLAARFGRTATAAALRAELAACRAARAFPTPPAAILDAAADALAGRFAASQRPVFNLTGTVLHTNLGRAPLPQPPPKPWHPPPRWNSTSPPASVANGTNTSAACCARLPAPRRPPWSTT